MLRLAPRRKPVRQFHHVAHVGRLNHMAVAGIAVAEVIHQLDVRRHLIAEIEQDGG